MGYDVKDFQVFYWRLRGWKKLGNEPASSEFGCGGHKWCVLSDYRHLSHLRNLKIRPGEYSSSRSAMPFRMRMTPPPSTSIVPAPMVWERIGTLASNSRQSSQILAIPPFIPSGVCNSQFGMLSLNLYWPSSQTNTIGSPPKNPTGVSGVSASGVNYSNPNLATTAQ